MRAGLTAVCLTLLMITTPAWSAGGATPAELRRDWGRLLETWHTGETLEGFPYLECFEQAAEQTDIPLPMLLGLAWGESAFAPAARSSKDAVGIMQIRWPLTARELGFDSIAELEQPCPNIDAGARYLRTLLDRVDDDPVLALASYNHGPTAIDGDDRNLNDHARWYVRYIYDKTAAVLGGRRWQSGPLTLRLGLFTDYGMARVASRRYAMLAQRRDELELELSIQRNAAGKYELRLPCDSVESLAEERARYERITGFVPN